MKKIHFTHRLYLFCAPSVTAKEIFLSLIIDIYISIECLALRARRCFVLGRCSSLGVGFWGLIIVSPWEQASLGICRTSHFPTYCWFKGRPTDLRLLWERSFVTPFPPCLSKRYSLLCVYMHTALFCLWRALVAWMYFIEKRLCEILMTVLWNNGMIEITER